MSEIWHQFDVEWTLIILSVYAYTQSDSSPSFTNISEISPEDDNYTKLKIDVVQPYGSNFD